MEEEIKLQDIQFPSDFQFTKTDNGFKINANGGEFFPHKNTSLFSSFSYLILIIIFYIVLLFCLSICLKSVIVFAIGLPIFSFLLIAAIIKMKYLTNIKTEYIFSPDGIDIISEKGTISIPKANIKNMYIKELTMLMKDRNEIYYSILIGFKEFLYIPYTNQNKETINLFIDYPFFEKKTASFLLQELNKTIDINYIDNYFEEKEKQVIDNNEIQLPKDLNYQRIDNGFKVTSIGGIFFPNIYAILAIIITVIIYIILFINLNTMSDHLIEVISEYKSLKPILSKTDFSESDTIRTLIGLIILFISSIIGIACHSFIKITTTKPDYIFSQNGINITSKGKVFSIKADNINDIHLENVVSATRTETSTSYKIVLDFKNWICITTNPVYSITKSKISSVDILENFKDKKVCLFFVQEMKRILKVI